LVLKLCLDDLVLIKEQLILNSYERVRLEEGGQNKNQVNKLPY